VFFPLAFLSLVLPPVLVHVAKLRHCAVGFYIFVRFVSFAVRKKCSLLDPEGHEAPEETTATEQPIYSENSENGWAFCRIGGS
jgi:hypothetical protein